MESAYSPVRKRSRDESSAVPPPNVLEAVETPSAEAVSTVEAWLTTGGNVDVRSADPAGTGSLSFTILMIACQEGHTQMMEMLLRRGAALELTEHTGCTALMLAVQRHEFGIALRLLRAGARTDARDKEMGWTACEFLLKEVEEAATTLAAEAAAGGGAASRPRDRMEAAEEAFDKVEAAAREAAELASLHGAGARRRSSRDERSSRGSEGEGEGNELIMMVGMLQRPEGVRDAPEARFAELLGRVEAWKAGPGDADSPGEAEMAEMEEDEAAAGAAEEEALLFTQGMQALREMGFHDEAANERALRAAGCDVDAAVAALLG